MRNNIEDNRPASSGKGAPTNLAEFYEKLYNRTLYTVTHHMPMDKIIITTKDEPKKKYAYFTINHETSAGKFAIECLITPKKISYKILDKAGNMREEMFYQYKETEWTNFSRIIDNWIHFLTEQLNVIDMTNDTYYTTDKWKDDSNNRFLKNHDSKYEWKDKKKPE